MKTEQKTKDKNISCKCLSASYGYHREDCLAFDVYGKSKTITSKYISFAKVVGLNPSEKNPIILKSDELKALCHSTQDIFPQLYHTIKIIGLDMKNQMAHLINAHGDKDYLYFSSVSGEKDSRLIYFEDGQV